VLQNFHVLIFCVDEFLYKWTYATKNCRSATIVSMWFSFIYCYFIWLEIVIVKQSWSSL